MKPTNDKQTQQPTPEQSQTPPPAAPKRKRFSLVRLEERIAPQAGGGGPPFSHRGCWTF